VQLPNRDHIEGAGARARIAARRAATPIIALTILVCFALLATILFYSAPKRIVSTTDVPNAVQRLKLQNDVRTTGTQLLVGIVLAVGAIFTARTFRLNREGQITERYTRAVEQIGDRSLQVRMGGIYALERIARESATDHGPIFEVLCALARTRRRDTFAKVTDALPDVQAVLDVIARRRSSFDPAPGLITLDGADLRGCSLQGANLRQASLQDVDLRDSVVADCDLRNALFINADLRNAFLDSDFRKATFQHADLQEAMVFKASRFDDALYDDETKWPESFDPKEAGAVELGELGPFAGHRGDDGEAAADE
jgi:Pentapeptide repeats (9 copies)